MASQKRACYIIFLILMPLLHSSYRFTTTSLLSATLLFCQANLTQAEVVIETPTILASVPLRSWKTLRDQHLVKQDFDYSCGTASLATVLGFYGKEVTELQVMEAMGNKEGMASFEEMAKALPKLGFHAQGIALSFEQLKHLKIPVIAYLKAEREDHFTVIRGGSDSHVWLGDPSWGNRTLTRARFLEMWRTREDTTLQGKVLLIQPINDLTLKPFAFQKPTPSRLSHSVIMQRQF